MIDKDRVVGSAKVDLVRRFGREPRMRATALLLQGRVPWEFPPEQATEAETTAPDLARTPTPALHGWTARNQPAPQFHVIGNGSLAIRSRNSRIST